jgi:hypothetical protein
LDFEGRVEVEEMGEVEVGTVLGAGAGAGTGAGTGAGAGAGAGADLEGTGTGVGSEPNILNQLELVGFSIFLSLIFKLYIIYNYNVWYSSK